MRSVERDAASNAASVSQFRCVVGQVGQRVGVGDQRQGVGPQVDVGGHVRGEIADLVDLVDAQALLEPVDRRRREAPGVDADVGRDRTKGPDGGGVVLRAERLEGDPLVVGRAEQRWSTAIGLRRPSPSTAMPWTPSSSSPASISAGMSLSSTACCSG